MDELYFKKIAGTIILAVLAVLAFLLIRPILLSIIIGIILAFAFSPVYNWIFKKTKKKKLSALAICIFLILLIIVPIILLTPFLIDQSIKFYLAMQQTDFITPLQNIFPSLSSSAEFVEEIGAGLHSFVTNVANSLMTYFSQSLLNFPNVMLQFFVVFFTLYFVLKDKEEITDYVKGLLPFSKELEKKLFDSSRDITSSVLYGQIIIGLIQGIILGVGFFIFKVPNAFLLSLLAIIAGIFPIIGPAIIGIPVVLYLFISGNIFAAIGIGAFTFFSSFIDNLLRPILVSKRTKLHPAVVLIGMIGGFMFFGIVGLVLGPLILAYLIIVVELYKNKKVSDIFIQEETEKL